MRDGLVAGSSRGKCLRRICSWTIPFKAICVFHMTRIRGNIARTLVNVLSLPGRILGSCQYLSMFCVLVSSNVLVERKKQTNKQTLVPGKVPPNDSISQTLFSVSHNMQGSSFGETSLLYFRRRMIYNPRTNAANVLPVLTPMPTPPIQSHDMPDDLDEEAWASYIFVSVDICAMVAKQSAEAAPR